MAEQPIARLLGALSTGWGEDIVDVALQCGCVVRAAVARLRVKRPARAVSGTLPCPVGHEVPPAPVPQRCPTCGAAFEPEVRACEGCEREIGWVGEPPCRHLANELGNQERLLVGSHPWQRGGAPGLYCMSCSMPPR